LLHLLAFKFEKLAIAQACALTFLVSSTQGKLRFRHKKTADSVAAV
jgi:hypothetical protein